MREKIKWFGEMRNYWDKRKKKKKGEMEGIKK